MRFEIEVYQDIVSIKPLTEMERAEERALERDLAIISALFKLSVYVTEVNEGYGQRYKYIGFRVPKPDGSGFYVINDKEPKTSGAKRMSTHKAIELIRECYYPSSRERSERVLCQGYLSCFRNTHLDRIRFENSTDAWKGKSDEYKAGIIQWLISKGFVLCDAGKELLKRTKKEEKELRSLNKDGENKTSSKGERAFDLSDTHEGVEWSSSKVSDRRRVTANG